MNIFFTSDTHFGHANIIRYSNRPFASVEEMNEEMIRRWNEAVSPNDTVYHLGDFSFRSKCGDQVLKRLHGHKHLVIGNHDKDGKKLLEWCSTQHYKELKIDEERVVLLHYPMASWNRSHRGALHLHGHCHGRMPGTSQRLDVGVDVWNYRPVTLSEIKQRLATLPSHHQEDYDGERN